MHAVLVGIVTPVLPSGQHNPMSCRLQHQVRTEQTEAEQVAAVVGAEETEVSAKAAECAALKAAAEAELVS